MIEDDHYTIPGAIAGFKKLVYKDDVLSILHCGGTGQIMALASKFRKQKIVTITLSLAEKLVNPIQKYIFTPAAIMMK